MLEIIKANTGGGSSGGWELAARLDPTSDSAEFIVTGLSSYKVIRVQMLLNSSANDLSPTSVAVRVSAGTWRELVPDLDPTGATDDRINGFFDITEFNFVGPKIFNFHISAGDVPVDRTDNILQTTTSNKFGTGYCSFDEVFDEIRINPAGSFEGTNATLRSTITIWGLV